MSQNQPNQLTHDFKAPTDINIKFVRLVPPLLNTDSTPLSGLYNDIDNIETDQENPLQDKFLNFDIIESSPNIENLFIFC